MEEARERGGRTQGVSGFCLQQVMVPFNEMGRLERKGPYAISAEMLAALSVDLSRMWLESGVVWRIGNSGERHLVGFLLAAFAFNL